MIKAASILNIPIYATTQEYDLLGHICTELPLDNAVAIADKSSFSMWPAIAPHFALAKPAEIAIVGIECHICITQTVLDLLQEEHKVYVLADGVSSGNREENSIALARLRQAGAVITTSESWIYECMGDVGIPECVTSSQQPD